MSSKFLKRYLSITVRIQHCHEHINLRLCLGLTLSAPKSLEISFTDMAAPVFIDFIEVVLDLLKLLIRHIFWLLH